MLLFTNLEDLKLDGQSYNPVPIMKLTGNVKFRTESLTSSQRRFWQILTEREAELNGFSVRI